jgi:hypothetical protein
MPYSTIRRIRTVVKQGVVIGLHCDDDDDDVGSDIAHEFGQLLFIAESRVRSLGSPYVLFMVDEVVSYRVGGCLGVQSPPEIPNFSQS